MTPLRRRQSNGEESHDDSLVRFSDVTEAEVQELVRNADIGNVSDATYMIGRSVMPDFQKSAIRETSYGTSRSSSSARCRRSVFRRMNTQMMSYYKKEGTEQLKQEENKNPRLDRIWFVLNVMLFIGLLWASYVWSLKDQDYGLPRTLIRAIAIYVLSFFVSFATVDAIDAMYGRIDEAVEANDKIEKKALPKSTTKIISILTQLVIISFLSFFGVYIASSPCFSCARIYQHGGDMASEGTDLLLGQSTRSTGVWKTILGPADDVDPGTEVCRACLSWLASIFLQKSRWFKVVDAPVGQGNPSGIVKSRHDLIRWYNEFYKTESKKYRDSSLRKLLEGLATNGVFSDDELYDVLDDLLCSPTSRIDSPDPAQFLSAIDRPRFTGEDVGGEGLDIPLDKLQAIMRGDMLRNLGPSVCFMLRFSLLIQEDDSSERFPISSVFDGNSLLSQADMKAQDCSFDAPGVVISGLDPDLDPKSSRIESIKNAISIFERLPFEDERYYFDTKEEYLAFFRWTLQSAIQSEWYLPTWLEHLAESDKDASIYTSFLSNPRVHSPDQSSLLDTLSDKTLADRVIYGTGQKFLSALKLPGDTDYFYYHPFGPDSYATWNHTKFYRYDNKPKNEDLLQMAQSFWPDDFKNFGNNCGTKSMLNRLKQKWRRPIGSSSPSGQCLSGTNKAGAILQEMRRRMVQIDMSFFGSIDGRKGQFHNSGCILYLDTRSRMPMGIFKTNMTDDGRDVGVMYLPTDGRDWDHAKYTYRTAERAVLASIHVKESHLGWSHALSVATLQTIPSDHKLHALLKPFTRGAHVVNSAAYHMLVREHSILAHSSGQVDGQDALLYLGHHMDFSETVPEMLEAKQLDGNLTKDMPLFTQGQRLWAVHYEFVSDFVTKILYDSDNAMRDDDSLLRFWHHVNTFGRGHDPCVCDMGASSFFKSDVWPSFDSSSDSTRTCNALLEAASFLPDLTDPSDRRREWCLQDDSTRIVALRNLLEEECKEHKKCKKLRHSFEHMRLTMGLKPLKTRKQLIDFLTSAIWHVSVGHSINGDNMAYLPDPTHAGVRMRGKDNNGELEIIADVGTYVFGITIGALTTVKNNALMADWTPIYSYLSEMQDDLTKEEKSYLFDSMDKLHRRYKMQLLTLSVDFLQESESRPKNQQSNVFNPMTHSASVCV